MMRALILTLAVMLPLGGTAHRETERGNADYEEGRMDDALRHYTEAQVVVPEAPELYYDIGNVLYRQGDFEGAADAFTKSLLSAPDRLRPLAWHNLGNARYRQENFGEAAEAYRRALRLAPDDVDAKRNLELALRALEQQQQQQQQQQEQQQDEQDDEQQEQQPQEQEQPSEGEQEQDEQQQQPSGGEQEREEQAEPQQSPEGAGQPMTPEQAERLLEGIEEQEQANAEAQRLRTRGQSTQSREKDW